MRVYTVFSEYVTLVRVRVAACAGDGRSVPKKCRAVYGLTNMAAWCKPCRRKKKCVRFGAPSAPRAALVHGAPFMLPFSYYLQQQAPDGCPACALGQPPPGPVPVTVPATGPAPPPPAMQWPIGLPLPDASKQQQLFLQQTRPQQQTGVPSAIDWPVSNLRNALAACSGPGPSADEKLDALNPDDDEGADDDDDSDDECDYETDASDDSATSES